MQEIKANNQISTTLYAAYLFGNASLYVLNWIWYEHVLRCVILNWTS